MIKMTATWKIQTQRLPLIFNENRGEFVENILINKSRFFCGLYNDLFNEQYALGKLKKKIQYKKDEFDITIVYGNDDKKMIFIEVPEPKKIRFFIQFIYEVLLYSISYKRKPYRNI